MGTGFLLTSDGLVATCAHVIASSGLAAGSTVQVEFLTSGERRDALVIPEYWRDATREDVALLQVRGEPPAGAGPLGLRRAAGSSGNRFSTYGFPLVRATSGLWGYGVLGDLVTDPTGVMTLQLTATTETSKGFSGGPVVDFASGRVAGMVSSIAPVDRHGRMSETAFATPTEVLRSICPRLRLVDVCPYRSLDHFEEEHAPFFFGRDRVTDSLISALAARPSFLAVLGPSGSGKSSLLRAGLIARLRRGALPGSEEWTILIRRPAELGSVEEELAGRADSRLVLVIDQFEELFALAPSAMQYWGRELARLAATDDVSVVLAMRDDFYSHLARELPVLMNTWMVPNLINVPAQLDHHDLVDIIEGPARSAGLTLDAGLTQAIVGDAVAASDGAGVRSTLLPLIEFALSHLWQRQDDGVLSLARFSEMGGVAGGLKRWADDSYYALPESSRAIARSIFTSLARLGDESHGTPDSRRRRSLTELVAGVSAAETREVLGSLVTARLVVTGRDMRSGEVWAELIHDSLLREWGHLTTWLTEDRQFLAWRQNLEYRLGTWSGSTDDDHDDTDWLRGRELVQAEHWLRTRPADLDARQRTFIEGSLAARERQRRHEEALRREAERQTQIAETRGLIQRLRIDAENALALQQLDPARALLSAVSVTGANLDAFGDEPLPFVQAGLFSSVRAVKERAVLRGHSQLVTGVAVDPSGRWVVSGSQDRTVRLWAMAGHGPATVLGCHDGDVLSVAVSPDGAVIASSGADRTVRLWYPHGRPVGAPLAGCEDAVLEVAFAPDSRSVAAACADGTVRLWPLPQGGTPLCLTHDSYVSSLAFSPDGDGLATGCGDGSVWLWRLGQDVEAERLADHDDFVTCVRFRPAGDLVATASADGTICLREMSSAGQRVFTPSRSRHRGLVTSLAFAAHGTALVFADEDGAVQVWDLSGSPAHPPMLCPRQSVREVAVSADSRWLAGAVGQDVRVWDWLPYTPARPDRATAAAMWDGNGDQAGPARAAHDFVAAVAFTRDRLGVVTAGGDRALRVWDRDGRARATVPNAHDGGVTALACAPGGFELIASGGRDNLVRLHDLSGRPLGSPLAGHSADVMAIAFRPDGAVIASGSRDGTVRLWGPDGRPQGAPLDGGGGEVLGVTFSPDGTLLASIGEDGAVRLWTADGTPYRRSFTGHTGHAWDVAFSPTGQTLMSCGDDGTVRLWNLDGEAIGRPLRGHTGGVRAGRFHPGGRMLVSAGEDGTLHTWHAEGGLLTRPMRGHEGAVFALALDALGEFAATGGEDGTLRIWRLGDWRSWLNESCGRLAGHDIVEGADGEAARAACEACRTHPDGGSPAAL
ncbi:trypsin-like peptidase domain-containing protein [Streptomyces sp. NPDC057620]|uniref:nSTAND1 domain-containing NTPase n=1 Tax=Streptomyces sp. NPDC057620 TaxID=3346185 RepID=UPI0036B74791